VTLDNQGRLYIGDSGNNRIVEFDSPLTSTTAQHVFGQADLVSNGRNRGGSPSDASLFNPEGISFDRDQNLLAADSSNNRVLVYFTPFVKKAGVPGSGDFIADLVFGQGGSFSSNTAGGGVAGLSQPVDVAGDSFGRYQILDPANNRVIEYDNPPAEQKTGGDFVYGQGNTGKNFNANLCGNTATMASNDFTCFGRQGGLGLSSVGTCCSLFVADRADHRILEYQALAPPNPNAAGVAGQGDFTHNLPNLVDGKGFDMPAAVAIDASAAQSPLCRRHRQ